ncbi:MAG: Cof-type HAD-IIB family hydrolase [Bacillota bacterium]
MKLIAVDMDGTLLNHWKEISEENIQAIKKAQSMGIEIVIATGRAYFDAKKICEKAGLNLHIISDNGALIHTKNGEQISSITMEKKDVKRIITELEEQNFYYEVFANRGIYTTYSRKKALEEAAKTCHDDLLAEKFQYAVNIQFGQTGIRFMESNEAILGEEEKIYSVFALSFDEKRLKDGIKHFGQMDHLSMISSADNNFELANKLTSKGNALEKLARVLNISLDYTAAVGDSYNDISMLEKANLGVAMGNAHDDIKALCDTVTRTNDENGVAYIINQIIDKEIVHQIQFSNISLA